MAILQVNNIYMGFSEETLFKDVSFSVDEKDKIGIIGVNGAGKTTLIKLLLDLENSEINPATNQRGTISKKSNLKIGYLAQNTQLNKENTIFNELMTVFNDLLEDYNKMQEINFLLTIDSDNFDKLMEELGQISERYERHEGYSIEYKIKQILNGLNIPEDLWTMKIKNLSGGQNSRVALAKILLEEPDLLILDEPTNHLDLASIEWLEEFLKKYNKGFLLVSHDRTFLDNVCNKIFELENKKLKTYKGNFSSFLVQKEMILKGEIKEYEKEQDRIKKLNEYINRNRAGRMAKQAKGRQKLLSHLNLKDNPMFNPDKMKLKFKIKNVSSENVLKFNNVCMNFENKKVLKNINLHIYKGEKIGIIGKNGCGKSTILKIAANILNPEKGEVFLADNASIAYYDQNHETLFPKNTILQEINTKLSYTNENLRSMAAAFLFNDDDIEKRIEDLSGGEKVRVSFIKLIQNDANFLILDEPTNHLDLYSIEILENALKDYEGTILLVSHNRHFIDEICNTIYVLDENGLTKFKGNYETYKQSLKNKVSPQKDTTKKEEYLLQKEKIKKINKLKKDIENIENKLENISFEKEKIKKEMFLPDVANNVEKLIDLQKKLNNLSLEEENLINLWQQYSIELEEEQNEI